MSLKGARSLREKNINQQPASSTLSGKESFAAAHKSSTIKVKSALNATMTSQPQHRKRDRSQQHFPPRKLAARGIDSFPSPSRNRNRNDSSLSSVPLLHESTRIKRPDIFDIWKSPVINLDDDTLRSVFQKCEMAETLSAIATVCRRWRTIVLDPSMWHTLHYEWVPFVKLMKALSKPGQFAPHLNHVHALKISNSPGEAKVSLLLPKLFPFKNLCDVRLENIYLDDLIELVACMESITELRCDKIRKRYKTNGMALTMFSKLQHLKTLQLHFDEECEHSGYTSRLSGLRQPLSSTLEVLAISNLCDSEEFWLSLELEIERPFRGDEDISSMWHPWNMMEQSLMTKYKPFSHLEHLHSLSLGDCRAFTARVWRECLEPCGKRLTDLSLSRWNGDGWRESPSAYQERREAAKRLQVNVEDVAEDVELALAEFIGSLSNLHRLALDQFNCEDGVIRGVASLDQLNPCMISSIDKFDGKCPISFRRDVLHNVKFVLK